MASLGRTVLIGESGKEYRFRVYPLGTKFRKKCGVFVITNRSHSEDGGHRHETIYVGQTEDVSQPFHQHRMAQQFIEHGANCICLHSEESEDGRLAKERDLIAALHPICND